MAGDCSSADWEEARLFPLIPRLWRSGRSLGLTFSPGFTQLLNRLSADSFSVGLPELEPHRLGHRGHIGREIAVEGGFAVVDGAGGVLEAIAGEHAHDRGAAGYFIGPLQQTCH